ncbi:M-phase inducer phosphatase 1-like isoform X2 [Leguminivora glycinivorella]|uniref:M-phase inducer phosphatase 1-like isoform X2 n=1 Tax=Leguminivora glycinivorella TaxID=1035111 RepID=UPI00200E44AF|nr:M-phase inducer phosphatase 1-like isoform X2 [Leguminivora glycinivorella]
MDPHTLNLSPKSPTPPKRRLGSKENSSPNIGLSYENRIERDFSLTPKPYKTSYENSQKSPFNPTPRKVLGEQNSPFNRTPRKILGELQNSPFNPTPKKVLSEVQNSLPTPRKVLGELQNSTPTSAPKDLSSLTRSPLFKLLDTPVLSPVSSQRSFKKINRIFEERSQFKMENMDKFEEETRAPFQFEQENWTATKLDFRDVLQTTFIEDFKTEDTFVPEKEELDQEFDTLHDLEEKFDNDTFDQCNKYEIISTDSPDIISRGRNPSNRKINGSFVFGAPLADTEQSTSFNRPARALNFEDSFEFPSPVIKKSSSSGSVKKSLKFSETPTKDSMNRIFTSDSTTSMESGFVSEFDDQLLDIEESNSPKVAYFDTLLSGQIIKNNVIRSGKQPHYRSIRINPAQSKARVSLLSILESPQSILESPQKRSKRSEPGEGGESKRRKCEEVRPVLQKYFSENNALIMSAFDRSDGNPDLIGDFSQPFALPLTRGNHSDLKSITCDTLAGLIRGDFENITDFQVIDCRYPYEFEGGHIAGAQNLYTPTQILQLVQGPRPQGKVLVFHCEFSLERGPKLSRFLRSSDREKNKENYPSLHYPEIYLLHEGYRAFYQRHPDLCSPAGYTAMLDPKHRDLLRQHRSVQQPSSSTHYRRNRLLF